METSTVPVLHSVLQVFLGDYNVILYIYTVIVPINGLVPSTISNFAPNVSTGYTVSPSNSRITLTSSGELTTTTLGSGDSGRYTFTSTDFGGAILVVDISVFGEFLLLVQLFNFFH